MNDIKLVVSVEYDGLRIDKCISQMVDTISRTYIQRLLKIGNVLLNGQVCKANTLVKTDDSIEFELPPAVETQIVPEDIPLDILYEDNDVLIINKPKGMVVHPAVGHNEHTLVNAVMHHCQNNLSGINGYLRPGIVHRIDKDTSGSIIICKNDYSHNSIANQLKEHTIVRKYRALVYGNLKEENGCIKTLIGRDKNDRKKMSVNVVDGRNAVTHFHCLEHFKDYTYMEFQLETGRTHQIRVHMASIHHPLVGDLVYGPQKDPFHSNGQMLHAMVLGFQHPILNEYIETVAPLPEYFENVLLKLRNS